MQTKYCCPARFSAFLLGTAWLCLACSQGSGAASSTAGGAGGMKDGGNIPSDTQSAGGALSAGGVTSSGSMGSTGESPRGGASGEDSSMRGGTPDAGVDAGLRTDAGRTGGTGGTSGEGASGGDAGGGSIKTGGTTGSGGGGATGGATSSDGEGCDIGVYDAASPPKVLSLTGNLGTHDPAAIAVDGTYYLYATGLAAKTSKDLTTWSAAGKPLSTPAWLSTTIVGVGDLWAPDVSFFGGKYHLYYAGSTFGANKSCIGHATRDSLATGSWVDSGAATLCSNVGSSDNWNAIDANVVLDDAGTPWMALGSFWSGLKIVQLDSDGKRVGTTVTSLAARPNNGGALEAPFIVRRCGYYYLFMSWDKCCDGAKSTYNIRVVRASKVTGPYSDKAGTAALQGGGTLIAHGDDTWAGPGGQSVMMIGRKAYLVYHAYAKSNGVATLRIADLVWDASGWPVPVGP